MTIRSRDQHKLSRKQIDPAALKVLYRLSGAGYVAYLVGGSVRDILLGLNPKDFDVSTDAHPQEIRRLFRNCFLIGRRFRLAHIRFGDQIIETSTFRRLPDPDDVPAVDLGVTGRQHYQHRDNTFGSPEEDAERRDFTVNGLFYDIKTFSVIDYVGGLADLDKRVLRSIGDPNIRFREDPVRMLRAVRFAARLGFDIERAAQRAIRTHYAEILQASAPRLFEEVLKFFGYQSAESAFRLLWSTRLMSVLLPPLNDYVQSSGGKRSPLWRYLAALDAEPANTSRPALCFAALFYPLLLQRMDQAVTAHREPHLKTLLNEILAPSHIPLPLPRAMREKTGFLVATQPQFDAARPSPRQRKHRGHPDFPDAIALRRIHLIATGGDIESLSAWNTPVEQGPPPTELHLDGDAPAAPPRKRRPRRRKPRTGGHGAAAER